jgi:hypothetical protein
MSVTAHWIQPSQAYEPAIVRVVGVDWSDYAAVTSRIGRAAPQRADVIDVGTHFGAGDDVRRAWAQMQ